MDATLRSTIAREQLLERRRRLRAAAAGAGRIPDLTLLLGEVDAALERIEQGAYGVCRECREPIEEDRLLADPLVRFCLDHLSAAQQRALEHDLELASQVQRALLPKQHLRFDGWEVVYQYAPAGPVSGDYCDLVTRGDSDLFFVLGDVAGKGVAASILTAHLNATFRTLIDLGLAVDRLVEHANRVFAESTMDAHFATLVCGRAGASGVVELCNAGHPAPLLVRGGEVRRVETRGVPVGILCDNSYSAERLELSAGDTLVLHTDGLSEALGPSREQYGVERLCRVLKEAHGRTPRELLQACLDDLAGFQAGTPGTDDLSLMVIRRNT